MCKQSMRIQMSQRVRATSSEDRMVADAHIASQVTQLPVWEHAGSVFAYVPMEDEVDITAILSAALRSGKNLALPRIDSAGGAHMSFHLVSGDGPGRQGWFGIVRTLERHSYGFLQPSIDRVPIQPAVGDLVLVPARAFDRRGNRLGRGGGYYDEFLSSLPPATHTLGLAYDLQVASEIPHNKDDVKVQVIITESETSFCRRI